MPAEMLHFKEWAVSKGLDTMTPGTWTAYTEYVRSYGVPVEPEPPPIPKPPTVTVVNRLQAVKVAGLRPRPAYSRVVSMLAIAKFQGNIGFAVSEAIANPFIVLDVWVRVLWALIDEPAEIAFRLTTGIGTQVTQADVERWDKVIPLIWESQEQFWLANQALSEFHWSLDKRYAEHAKRLALWVQMTRGGASIANVYASYRIAEG